MHVLIFERYGEGTFMKQRCKLVGVSVTAALLAACGAPSNVAGPPAPVGAAGSQATLAHKVHKLTALEYVYVTNALSNDVSAYVVNTTSGALTPVRRSPVRTRAIPWGVSALFGEFVYVVNGVSTNQYARRRSTVSAYKVNARSGVLTRVSGSPFADAGRGAAA
jgi:6-phosphogluconolactonase